MSPKKKRPGFVRTTISLPADLRRQMKSCGKHVNWSAVAARAFQGTLARIHRQKEDVSLDDVVARLRATIGTSRSELFERGRLQGVRWAHRQATADQLRRLYAKHREAKSTSGVNYENWISSIDDKRSAMDVLSEIVGLEQRTRRSPDSEALMKSTEYAHGFAAGALHVWKQVARRLRGESDEL
jgi:hypothetical protein